MIIAIKILTTIAPQFLKYGDCCGFAFLPNNKWNHVSHWLESIIVIISILSASWMYSLHCIHCIQWYLLKLHLSVIIACFVVLRIFDTFKLGINLQKGKVTFNEAIDISKSCLKFLIVWIYEDWPLTGAPLQDWCILEWGGNISRWQWFFFGKLSWQWSKDPYP